MEKELVTFKKEVSAKSVMKIEGKSWSDQAQIPQLLKNKTNRHDSKKKLLTKQLEFYFSDINLYNDKFLRELIEKDSENAVDINIILQFNKIKSLLAGVEDEKTRKVYLRKSVESSNKIMMLNNKIVRREKFQMQKQNTEDIDSRTIYVQNLPSNITHDEIYTIFEKCGKISHVSIPKFQNTKQAKGFCFITFNKRESVEESLKEMNNYIPKEVIKHNSSEVLPLEIMSKKVWLEKKAEFKKLKQELQYENADIFTSCLELDPNKCRNQLIRGTLIKFTGLPENISKVELKNWISHFAEPAYIDYNKYQRTCIIRFPHPLICDEFISKINFDNFPHLSSENKIHYEKMENEDEEKYFSKVNELKKEYKDHYKNKKMKK
jgi:RNA recognition motif-containing protein